MRCILISLTLAALTWASQAEEERLAINDLKAPQNRLDLEEIQKALQASLPKSRAATVCIEMDNGSGSGVIISADGLVMTAAHVAVGVKKKVTVIMEDGTRLKAETLGLVANTDAAMIQITDQGTYPHVEIDRAGQTRLGDWVYSLGHSGGFDKERGSVLRLGRLVRMSDGTFQSDCRIIGGDSGGPLFDLRGNLIGIHSRVGMQLQLNMHVPMTEFISNWDGLLKAEFIGEGPYAEKPVKGNGFLGIASEPSKKGGLRVTKVGSKSPAETAGIKVGDLLRSCNGQPLQSHEQFQEILKELSVGDELTLETERGGKPKSLTVKLGAR